MDSDFHNLLLYAKGQGINIVFKHSKDMYGYVGLHWMIDKKMGLHVPENQVWVDKNLHKRDLFRTLNHELLEIREMQGDKSYWDAHKFASKHELDNRWFA